MKLEDWDVQAHTKLVFHLPCKETEAGGVCIRFVKHWHCMACQEVSPAEIDDAALLCMANSADIGLLRSMPMSLAWENITHYLKVLEQRVESLVETVADLRSGNET